MASRGSPDAKEVLQELELIIAHHATRFSASFVQLLRNALDMFWQMRMMSSWLVHVSTTIDELHGVIQELMEQADLDSERIHKRIGILRVSPADSGSGARGPSSLVSLIRNLRVSRKVFPSVCHVKYNLQAIDKLAAERQERRARSAKAARASAVSIRSDMCGNPIDGGLDSPRKQLTQSTTSQSSASEAPAGAQEGTQWDSWYD